jgi:hypothetical protein
MKTLKLLFVAAISALVTSCGGGGGSDASEVGDLNFALVDTDLNSGIREQRFAVIKSAADWTAFWMAHKTGAQVTTPTIDFSQKMVVGVFLGQRPSGCYAVAIKGVTQSAGKITVQYKETVPSPNMSCTMALTFPSQIATIPASDLPVEFAAVQ